MIRWLAILACALTVAVTAASAFIRHAQAGVGCTPWPECYRSARAAGTPADHARAEAVTAARALHRVSAMTVGLLALALALFGWSAFDRGERVAAGLALADVVALAWLGRLTPHDLPLVTIGNVVGGFALAAAFGWLAARPRPDARAPDRPGGKAPGTGTALPGTALAVLALMAALGVMIATRHAIDACDALACLADARFDAAAFDPARGAPGVDEAAGRALKLAHRVAAVPFVAVALLLAVRLQRRGGGGATLAVALAALVALQVVAGLATAAGAALATHVVHNAGAALLAVVLAALARRGSAPSVGHPGSSRRAPGAR